MAVNKRRKDLPTITLSSGKLRAIMHEAWKHGNDSTNIHTEPEGERERHVYVSRVMIDRGFKEEL